MKRTHSTNKTNLITKGGEKMKKTILLAMALVLVFAAFSTQAQATVLTFDDLATPSLVGTQIANGYGGLSWINMYYLDGTNHSYGSSSGYLGGIVSENNVAYNGWGYVSITQGLFNFYGAYFSAAWYDDLNIKVVGYKNGLSVGAQTIQVDMNSPAYFNFNFLNIDTLSFSTWTADLNNQPGTQFVMDNFTYNPVPEPGTLLLLGSGLVGLAFFARRRKQA